MTLDDFAAVGIVTGYIEDSELGRRWIACVGRHTPGGIRSDDGQYGMADTELEAARQCYDAMGFEGEGPGSAD